MEIKQMPGGVTRTEYGYPRQYDVTYQVLVTATESAGLDRYTIHRIVENQPIFQQLTQINTSCTDRVNGGYKFIVTGSILQDALKQDDFVFSYSGSLVTEPRGTDIHGFLNTVQYPAGATENIDQQTAIVDVALPSMQMQATGIRDLSRYASADTDPALVLKLLWEGTVNSSLWRGIPARRALCTNCDCQPLYLKAAQYVYIITLQFALKTHQSHDPWIFYTLADGTIPNDAEAYLGGEPTEYDASYRQSHQYPSHDYNETFPLGTEDEE